MDIPSLDERLLDALRSSPLPKTAKELTILLEVSQPTLSRALDRLGSLLVILGRARTTRYALARDIPDIGHHHPIIRINPAGKAERVGELLALVGGHFYVQMENGKGQIFDDLPWFIWDMRPQGFLGRTLTQQYPELSLPSRWQDWNSDDILHWLARYGANCPGDLIIGEAAFQSWLRYQPRLLAEAFPLAERTINYPALATATLQGAAYNSSAGGEQPKFAAACQDDAGNYHNVLVKFSPPTDTPAGKRWADLLICEHLALQLLAEAEGAHAAARSTIIEAEDRIFLEVERFDRARLTGRCGMVSLEAVNAEYLGLKEQTWEAAAISLLRYRRISKADHDALLRRAVFAQLIANTDRHFGNISFFWDDRGQLTLAPAYDMLPMAFAPMNNEIINRDIPTLRPRSDTLIFWEWGKELAARYWQLVKADERISVDFRGMVESIF